MINLELPTHPDGNFYSIPEINALLSQLTSSVISAESEDAGKIPVVKTVVNGVVTEWEYTDNPNFNASQYGLTKLPDGTLIQYGIITGLAFANENLKTGETAISEEFLVSASNPVIFCTPFSSNSASFIFLVGANVDGANHKFKWALRSMENISITNRGFQYVIIGRWK